VLTIVRRTCYGWLARNRPADVVSLEAEEERGAAVVTSAIDAEGLLESRSNLRLLHQLIEALPARCARRSSCASCTSLATARSPR
jgi:DNA-directed RNA polymerase specialized sigma24 family protein